MAMEPRRRQAKAPQVCGAGRPRFPGVREDLGAATFPGAMVPLSTLSLSLPSLRMQALEAGPAHGPLVLLLHGFPELSGSWREVLPVLGAAGFRAVAPDLRGYGGTDRPRYGYDLDTLSADI